MRICRPYAFKEGVDPIVDWMIAVGLHMIAGVKVKNMWAVGLIVDGLNQLVILPGAIQTDCLSLGDRSKIPRVPPQPGSFSPMMNMWGTAVNPPLIFAIGW